MFVKILSRSFIVGGSVPRSYFVGLLVFLNFIFGLNAAKAAILPGVAASSISVGALEVLSFKDWRSEKLSLARARYSKLQTDYILKKSANPKDTTLKSLYSELKNTKSNLDEVSELTVADYFVGYLSRFKDQKQAFNKAAEKLNSLEVAELMTAYADSLLKTSGEGLSTHQPGSATEASK